MRGKIENLFLKGSETESNTETIKIRVKKLNQIEQASVSPSSSTTENLSTSSVVTEEIIPKSEKMTIKSFGIRCIKIITTIIGVIGGIHSIYQIMGTYIIQQEERMEVVVIRRI